MELRFDVGREDLARLARAPNLAGLAAGHPATRRLSTVYYDTPQLAFAKAGYGLRVRKSGRSYVQTVKSEATGPLESTRGEYENRLPSPVPDLRFIPDPDVRETLQAIAKDGPVEAVIETDIRRTTRALTTAAGDEIELALDRGEIRALNNGNAVPVSELELELKRGSPAALFDVARALAHETQLVVNLETKSERGLRAHEGGKATVRKAGRVELPADATAEESFRAILSHCLRHIARNTGAVAERKDPEGVHQMRVGFRRLRVGLNIMGDTFAVPAIEDLRARAKRLGDALASTRELDVFSSDLLASAEAANTKPDLSPLRDALEELREGSWAETVALVHSEDFTGLLLDLASAIESRVWREGANPERLGEYLRPVRMLAGAVLDKRLKGARKRARHLSKLGIAERHRLRIALKKLRYTAEFLGSQFDAKALGGFQSALAKLQDLFGDLNDAATAEHILTRIADGAGAASRALPQACAFVLGWHESRVPLTWKKAKKRWKRFAKTEPFWTG